MTAQTSDQSLSRHFCGVFEARSELRSVLGAASDGDRDKAYCTHTGLLSARTLRASEKLYLVPSFTRWRDVKTSLQTPLMEVHIMKNTPLIEVHLIT